MPRINPQQTTSSVLMIRPASFGFNEETAVNNAFQTQKNLSENEVQRKALAEFETLVEKLKTARINVHVLDDTRRPAKPDAIFPNNWISCHHDGTLVTYPMFSPVRRLERRDEIIQYLQQHFLVKRKIQLEEYESINQYLEGTGSMVFDHSNNLVFACLSPRTSEYLLDRFCHLMKYEPVIFSASDSRGIPIYHTNVMMAIGETFAVVCLDSISDEKEKNNLIDTFSRLGKKIIPISLDQVASFAGNMLQLRNDFGETFLVMSEQAYKSLHPSQISEIQKQTNILHSPIDTIETTGGGSARCMIAEIFLEPL